MTNRLVTRVDHCPTCGSVERSFALLRNCKDAWHPWVPAKTQGNVLYLPDSASCGMTR